MEKISSGICGPCSPHTGRFEVYYCKATDRYIAKVEGRIVAESSSDDEAFSAVGY